MSKVEKELTSEEQELFNELKTLSKRANQRIVRIEREFGKNTWATKFLKEKLATEPLQAWTKTGRVKANKSMTVTQMKATIKATKEFLNSSISTKKGIQKAKEKAIKTLKTRFSTDVHDITYEEAEALTNFFSDVEVNKITSFIPGSEVIAIIEEAIEKHYDYQTFSEQMEAVIIYNRGTNIEPILRKIYIKYIYKGRTDSSELDILYSNILELINKSMSESDLQEIENIVSNLLSEDKIDSKEYNYLLNLINDKRKEI